MSDAKETAPETASGAPLDTAADETEAENQEPHDGTEPRRPASGFPDDDDIESGRRTGQL